MSIYKGTRISSYHISEYDSNKYGENQLQLGLKLNWGMLFKKHMLHAEMQFILAQRAAESDGLSVGQMHYYYGPESWEDGYFSKDSIYDEWFHTGGPSNKESITGEWYRESWDSYVKRECQNHKEQFN